MILPLNFEEYLGMKQYYDKTTNPNLMIELNNYLNEGGFPRTVLYDTLADKRPAMKNQV